MEHTDDLRKSYHTAVIINAAVIGTLIAYAVVIEILRKQLAPFQGFMEITNFPALRYIFYGVAVVNIFIIRITGVSLLRKRYSDEFKFIRLQLLKVTIIIAALCEIPAVLGLILFLLAGSVRDYYQLAGVSFILVFLHFPRYGKWVEWAKNPEKNITSCG
jgi:hypothetical protein